MRSGRPREPGKVLKKVGGFAPHIFEGFPGPPEKPGQTAFRYPVASLGIPVILKTWVPGTPVCPSPG